MPDYKQPVRNDLQSEGLKSGLALVLPVAVSWAAVQARGLVRTPDHPLLALKAASTLLPETSALPVLA